MRLMSIITIKHIAEFLEGLKKIFESRTEKPPLPINSLPAFNRRMWGLRPGELTVIAARSGHCKSGFGSVQIPLDLVKQEIPTLLLTIEMSEEEILERMFCNKYRINNEDLMHGKFSSYKKQWEHFVEDMQSSTLTITSLLGKNWQEISDYVASLEHRPKVIILDHINEIAQSANMAKGELDEYIRNFRELARTYGHAAVLLCQINRTGQDSDNKEPQLHQLKGTGCLEEMASVVIMLHWAHQYAPKTEHLNKFKIILAKNRKGQTGFFDITIHPECYFFTEDNTPWAMLTEEPDRKSNPAKRMKGQEVQIESEWSA